MHNNDKTNTSPIDIAALLDLPSLQQRLAAHIDWLVQITTEAGFENAREQVTQEIKANPWALLMDFAQGMVGNSAVGAQ